MATTKKTTTISSGPPPPPRVSLHFGLTLPGPAEYTSFRADVTLTDIDAAGDVGAQLELQREAIAAAARTAEEALAQEASNLMGVSLEGLGLETQLKQFRKAVKKRLAALEERLAQG